MATTSGPTLHLQSLLLTNLLDFSAHSCGTISKPESPLEYNKEVSAQEPACPGVFSPSCSLSGWVTCLTLLPEGSGAL